MSRVEFLIDMRHEALEGNTYSRDGLNAFQLTEKLLADGNVQQAVSNLMRQPRKCFELANFYWAQGGLAKAEKYLRMTLERYERFLAIGKEHGLPINDYKHYGEETIKAAAVVLDVTLAGPVLTRQPRPGYQPAFENFLLDRCIGNADFDMAAWQALEDAWLKNRFPKYKLAEYAVYVKSLTGGFASDAEMLTAHEKMWAGKAKRNPDAGTLEGYGEYNAYVIDYIFAAILKRIGWEGTYRHSWPNTCPAGTPPKTTRPSDRHLDTIEAPPPMPDEETGIIEDPAEARRFIDQHVPDQRDWWENKHFDPLRPGKERGKVAKALKELGWKADPATLDLMRTYRMDEILNDSTHLFISDPIGDRYCSLKNWTQLFVEEYGMSEEFIAVAESEEKADYSDPQGGWYVLWKKDRRIYLVERDEWGNAAAATANARPGFSLWPCYVSFVAWWVQQHLDGDGKPDGDFVTVAPA